MENNEIHLSKTCVPDVIIKHKISKEILKDTFCFNVNNHSPTVKNIHNNNITLYTFLNNDYKKLFVDISKLRTSVLDKHIANEFLTYVSKLKHKSDNYKKHIQNHDDIQTYIDVSCKEKAQEDMKWAKGNSKITPSNNEKYNVTCGKLLSTLFEQVPGRFDTGNNVTQMPFKKNDKIIYYCTITAGNIKRIYEVNIHVY
jgi:hypothetical protein